jgi:hypothetical protein
MMRDDKLIELFRFYAKGDGTAHIKPEKLGEFLYKQPYTLDKLRDYEDARRHAAWMALEAIKFIEEAKVIESKDGMVRTSVVEDPVNKSLGTYVEARLAGRSKREKAHRWLGFIQGVLWMSGVFTLDELKEHSHRCSDDYTEADAKDDKAAMDDDARKS